MIIFGICSVCHHVPSVNLGGDPHDNTIVAVPFHTERCFRQMGELDLRVERGTGLHHSAQSSGAGPVPSSSDTHVAHVEVDDVFGVGPLNRYGKGLEGVEGEGHQPPHRVVNRSPQESRLDFEL